MTEEKILPIPEEVKGKDVWIVLIKELEKIALYLNKSDGYFAGFEVHKIRIKKAETKIIKDKKIQFKERKKIASNREFGTRALAYPTLDLVYKKYPEFKPFEDEIQNKVEECRKKCLRINK